VSSSGANLVIANSNSKNSYITSSSYGLFLYSDIDSKSNYNTVMYTSVAYSNQLRQYTNYYTIHLFGGINRIILTNSTNNYVYKISSIDFKPNICSLNTKEVQYSTKDAFIYFSTFINNIATYSCCVCFCCRNGNGALHYTSECNFVNNTQNTDKEAIIRGHDSHITIVKSCFVKNSAKLFYFSSDKNNLIENCTIDRDSKITGYVTVSFVIYYEFYPNYCIGLYKEPILNTIHVHWFSATSFLSYFLI
jgi:hypothetical protein